MYIWLHQEWQSIQRIGNSEILLMLRPLRDLSQFIKNFEKNWKWFKQIETISTCQITTVLSRVGKRVTVRVGKISLRVGSCPPLPTLSYATDLNPEPRYGNFIIQQTELIHSTEEFHLCFAKSFWVPKIWPYKLPEVSANFMIPKKRSLFYFYNLDYSFCFSWVFTLNLWVSSFRHIRSHFLINHAF